MSTRGADGSRSWTANKCLLGVCGCSSSNLRKLIGATASGRTVRRGAHELVVRRRSRLDTRASERCECLDVARVARLAAVERAPVIGQTPRVECCDDRAAGERADRASVRKVEHEPCFTLDRGSRVRFQSAADGSPRDRRCPRAREAGPARGLGVTASRVEVPIASRPWSGAADRGRFAFAAHGGGGGCRGRCAPYRTRDSSRDVSSTETGTNAPEAGSSGGGTGPLRVLTRHARSTDSIRSYPTMDTTPCFLGDDPSRSRLSAGSTRRSSTNAGARVSAGACASRFVVLALNAPPRTV